jgi:hypothetical protein
VLFTVGGIIKFEREPQHLWLSSVGDEDENENAGSAVEHHGHPIVRIPNAATVRRLVVISLVFSLSISIPANFINK